MDEDIRTYFEDEEISRMLNGLDADIIVPAEVSDSWKQAIRREERKRRLLQMTYRISEAAAAVILVIGATILWHGSMINSADNEAVKENQATALTNDYVYYTAAANVNTVPTTLYAFDGGSGDSDLIRSEAAADMALGVFVDENTRAKKTIAAEIETDDDGFDEEDEYAFEEAAMDIDNVESKVYFASLELSKGDARQTNDALHKVVSAYDAYFENEIISTKDSNTINGIIRVKNEQLNRMLEEIEMLFPSACIQVEAKDIVNNNRDLGERLDSAYILLDSINDSLRNNPNATEIEELNTRLNMLYDEIDNYETLIRNSETDLEYATVYYSVSAQKDSYVAASSGSTDMGSYLKALLNVILIILPTAALSAFITLRISSKKKKLKL